MESRCSSCQGPLWTQEDGFGKSLRCPTCGLSTEPGQAQLPMRKRKDYEIDLGAAHLQDRGCEIARRCTECPLPECRFDNPGMYRRYKRVRENEEMIQAVLQERLTNAQAARKYGGNPRTIGKLIIYHQETCGTPRYDPPA